MTFTHALSTNRYGEYAAIVATSAANGTHTTLASAMAACVSGDTIMLRDSVTENLTITPGVNIIGAMGGSLNLPSITGTLTMTGAGTSNISNIRLVTNSAALIAVTGSAASILNLMNCYLNCSNNTGITFSAANTSAQINLNNCLGNLGTTGIAYFSDSSTGQMNIVSCNFLNTGSSLTASTKSAGRLYMNTSVFTNAITYSSSNSASSFFYSNVDMSSLNTTALTTSGTGTLTVVGSYFASGTASAISIGTGTTINLSNSNANSSNTNSITGAGTILYSGITFAGTSKVINTTTQTDSGTLQGSKNTAPSAGFLGEQIRATIASGSAANLVNNTPTNITSISLTAGIWDVTGIAQVSGAAGTTTSWQGSVGTTSATLGTGGDNNMNGSNATLGVTDGCATVPAYRLTLTATTTTYLVCQATIAAGTVKPYGRISATRVG